MMRRKRIERDTKRGNKTIDDLIFVCIHLEDAFRDENKISSSGEPVSQTR